MKITNVTIHKLNDEELRLKAIASVTLDDSFVVHGIRIIQGEENLFIAMPSKKTGETHKDICHPINKETRQLFEEAVISKYKEEA